MKKKILSIMLASVLVLGGCGKAATPEATKPTEVAKSPVAQTVTVWAWDKNFNIPIMQDAAKIYSADHPNVTIKVVDYAKADVETKLQTGLVAGAADSLPDITLVEDYNAQKYLTSYPGKFADLTATVKSSDFAKYKVDAVSLDGKTYAVPFDSGVSGMFYRTDILAKAGYKPADMKDITWDQFIKIGKDVKTKTGKAMISMDVYNDAAILREMIQSCGQWYFDKDGKVTMANNQSLIDAVTKYKEIQDAGIVKNTVGWGDWVASMNKGDVATVNTGVWIMGSIKAATDQSGKWAVAAFPRLATSNSVNATNLGGSSWYVLNDSKNKDVAIDFLKTVYAGNNDFFQKILVERGAVGTYLPSQTGTAYSAGDKFFGDQEVFQDFSGWMKKIPGVSYGSYAAEGDQAIMAQMKDILSGKITVKAGLKNAEDQLSSQIQ
ncbi:extracellular solute-binding protein [Clostridium bowmanii]|uniref:ABC transporter substrate-binding protein n=1 Tax=Clostridium bowmanii TaxID=132925 RepID=UPI001C0DB6FC|nr:extracellular solute-binding protein [Clostridium bowmanii]MBU3188132.1 extracellular solute-binding protein [Clostridium bowmanii]MCA1072314.1 extracellular solute-binding protein [Clostridium bowmanii]